MDYNRRKQPIYFYNPRPTVLSVLKGVCLENFVHVCTQEELDYMIQGNMMIVETTFLRIYIIAQKKVCPDEALTCKNVYYLLPEYYFSMTQGALS